MVASINPKDGNIHPNQIWSILSEACDENEKVRQAYDGIVAAIDDYKKSYPINDGRLVRNNVATTRSEILRLSKRLEEVSEAMNVLSLESATLISNAMDMSFGEFKAVILPLKEGIEKAGIMAKKIPDKQPDHYRVVFARDVAKAMADASMKVATTRPSDQITGGRGGALYGRVLQAACS